MSLWYGSVWYLAISWVANNTPGAGQSHRSAASADQWEAPAEEAGPVLAAWCCTRGQAPLLWHLTMAPTVGDQCAPVPAWTRRKQITESQSSLYHHSKVTVWMIRLYIRPYPHIAWCKSVNVYKEGRMTKVFTWLVKKFWIKWSGKSEFYEWVLKCWFDKMLDMSKAFQDRLA